MLRMNCVTRCILASLRQSKKKLLLGIQRPSHVTVNYSGCTPLVDKYNPKEDKVVEKPLQENQYSKKEAAEILNNLTEEGRKKLQILKLEYEVWSIENSHMMPLEMKDEWWAAIMNLDTPAARKKLYRYLSKTDYSRRNQKIKKDKKRNELENTVEVAKDPAPEVNRIFLRLYPSTERIIYDAKLAQSMQFGRPFIIDMSYESHMRPMENTRCVEQLLAGLSVNRKRVEPSDLILTDWISNSYIYKKLNYTVKNRLHNFNTIMWKTTDQHYLDLYPKDRLVYLSPHSPFDLLEDHPDNVYIIGGYVDMVTTKQSRPMSNAKAKSEGIRCYKLPLDRYVRWKMGTKSLTINQTMAIMFDFMDTKDWNQALDKNLPKRKLLLPGDEDHLEETRANSMRDSKRDSERYRTFMNEQESVIKVRSKYAGNKRWKNDFY